MKPARSFRLLLPLTLTLALALSSSKGFCQSKADFETMHNFRRTFHERAQDFISFAKASKSPDEPAWIAESLISIAGQYTRECAFIAEEVFIVLSLETETDKQIARKILRERLNDSSREIDEYTLGLINEDLANATRPATVAGGNKLKDDLRGLQKTLQEISDKAPESGKVPTAKKTE